MDRLTDINAGSNAEANVGICDGGSGGLYIQTDQTEQAGRNGGIETGCGGRDVQNEHTILAQPMMVAVESSRREFHVLDLLPELDGCEDLRRDAIRGDGWADWVATVGCTHTDWVSHLAA